MKHMTTSEKAPLRNSAIDGLRAFFMIIIVMSHCGLFAQGGVGNCFFFTLSGFLLVGLNRPEPEERFLSLRGILRFYVDKAVRILPTYWVTIIIAKLCTGATFYDRQLFIDVLLMRDGWGPFWYLQNLMVIYLFIPLVMIPLGLVRRLFKDDRADLISAALLAVVSYATRTYLTTDIISLYGRGVENQLWIWAVAIGMAFAYLVRFICAKRRSQRSSISEFAADIILFLFLLAPFITSNWILRYFDSSLENYLIGWTMPVPVVIACGIAIALVFLNPDCRLCSLLGTGILSFIGRISMNIYLVHFFLIKFSPFEKGLRMFLAVFCLSIALAFAEHVLVEKPVLEAYKQKSLKPFLEALE